MIKKNKDYILLIILLLTSFLSVYFMPVTLNRLIFLVILAAAFRTRYDYVYLVWFFIINDAPGNLFSARDFHALRIPLYPVSSGISISFQELFVLLYLFKYIRLRKTPKFIFKKEFVWFFIFGLFVVIYSFLLGMGFDNIVKTFRIFLPWSLVFILPTYIHNKEILIRSSLLLFPMVFLAFASQIFYYVNGDFLDNYLRGVDSRYVGSIAHGSAFRSYSAVYTTLLSIIMAFYYLFSPKSGINRNYLGMVIFFGILSIFLSATRGWIVALSFLIVGAFFIFGVSRDLFKWIRIGAVSALALWVVGSQFPIVQSQIDMTFKRLSTLEALASGDVTAGGTLGRLDVRGPRVLSKFWESPFVGWGFSDGYYAYIDAHVGHHNILLNVGIIGYIFVNGLFVYLCHKIWTLSRKSETRRREGNAPLIFVVGLLTVMVIHSSSTQLWGYTFYIEKTIFLAFLFCSINAVFLNIRQKKAPPINPNAKIQNSAAIALGENQPKTKPI